MMMHSRIAGQKFSGLLEKIIQDYWTNLSRIAGRNFPGLLDKIVQDY
jgi:hypothetical protein